MSESLRDSAENHLIEALELMQKDQIQEALKTLGKAEEAAYQAKANDIFLYVQTLKGHLMQTIGAYDEALKIHSLALIAAEELLSKNPDSESYQSILQMNLDAIGNLGNLFYNMGRFPQTKNCYELHLSISQKLLKNDPENITYQSDVAMILNNLGNLLSDMGRIEEAKQRYEKALEICEKVLNKDPENITYQSYVGGTLNNLGALLSDMGRIEEAKQRYEKALEIYEKLLKNDPENITYQSYVGGTLNNLGALLSDMGRIEEAKQRYEKALEIFTEPMQYLTIGRKSQAIIRVIELNLDLAEEETNDLKKMEYLKESYQLCKKNKEFFITYGLRHERKLVMEAGFSAYVDYVMKNIRFERDSKKRASGYEKAINTIEILGKSEDDEEVEKIASSTVCYLEGRKLVNQALESEQPDLELIKQAANQFNDAKETYKKANICYCIYIGLLKILENVELFEEGNSSKAKEMIKQVIEILPEKIDPGIRAAFEEIAKIFDEKDVKSRKKHLGEFDEKIRAIEYKALENLFGHVQKKLNDYIEEPFSPNLFYSNWKLRIIFDAEKIKGKLTVKTGNTILFGRALSRDEIKDNAIEIDYLERRYVPGGEDVLIFETPNQKPVVRELDYSETISRNKKARIILHDCRNVVCTGKDLKVAAVQLRYDVYGEDYAVKPLESEAYKRKVMAILEAIKEKANIVVFPEFSIPFDYLEDIQEYANETGIIVFAGTHYVTEENLEKYEKLFASEFAEEDFRKNICPVVIPNL